MKFSRWRAAGNEYLLVERAELGGPLTPERVREEAVGSDGILEVVAADAGDAEIVIWNPDGSIAELSGNGTRIAARWLAERSRVDAVTVRSAGRAVPARLLPSGEIEQEIGPYEVYDRERVAGLEVVPVRVGNPHAVVVGKPDDLPLIGPLLETHPRFPERTNVQVARVDGPGRVTARVWERGVGETQSSGTSAVAVAAATHDGGEVVVTFPGGDLLVVLRNGAATLTGPAERVGESSGSGRDRPGIGTDTPHGGS
jgi:diaminopimelate epimerase